MSLLHKAQFPKDIIDTQLAHAQNNTKYPYDRWTQYPERQVMMQYWGDFLERIKKQ